MTTYNTPNSLICALKEADQDFEFYPTTAEIIAAVVKDLKESRIESDRIFSSRSRSFSSVLDIGAGNGKVLHALEAADVGLSELYAIEKSPILRQQLGADVFVVGTEFEQQSLLSKQIDVIFSNPPYSEFVPWTVNILREAAAHRVYLVVPVRWKESLDISEAISFRDAKAHVLGEYSFEHAEDRTARARVNLIRVQFSQEKSDAFERFFNEQFGHLKERFEARRTKNKEREPGQEKQSPFASLVVGENYPEAMVGLYNAAMAKIQRNYEAVGNLDVELLAELGVEPEKIMTGLKQRLEGLRNLYWHEIFGRMAAVTDRLTSKRRRLLLDTLNRHAHVDFTVDNIYAVILWVIKNANEHLDAQLVETFEAMVEKANVKAYKSNERPFVWDRWRYRNDPTAVQSTHFALEYRIVLQHVGGVRDGDYSFDQGLEERAADFLGDLLTVARNLGFQNNTADWRLHGHRQSWQSNQKEEFRCINPVTKNSEVLLEVRAFKNGNCHIRMHQRFALALNVEYGRLKGWLNSGTEAADELREEEAAALFRSNLCLPTTGNSMLLLAA